MNGEKPVQFCALEYDPQGWCIASSQKATIVLLVFKGGDGSLRFLINPKLRTIVQGKDLAYIEALLQDFLGRAKQDPAALFKQISSLGVGPLVTKVLGSNLVEYAFIQELASQFVQI
jgi:hypothetical protein